ncbi:hypothetical protein, partial [Candidatus Electronema sp. TJ]|uniref:hypothetical protein n=1 Tax=Candidatus Electronema sp. TJ TaxID=3401573 RepID=UPI003AA8C66B
WKAKPTPFDSQKACCLMWTLGTGLPVRRLRALPDLLHELSVSSLPLHSINGCGQAEARLKRFFLLRRRSRKMRSAFTLSHSCKISNLLPAASRLPSCPGCGSEKIIKIKMGSQAAP